jgi:hypothetical protein
MASLRTFYNPSYNEHTPINQLPGFGKDSWIKYRLNRSYTNPWPKSELDIYLCPTAPSQIVPWEQAAKNVAVDIASAHTNIYVAMSGGIDSEFVARTFLELGIPFTPIIFKVEDLNELDIWWAFKWCREKNIEPVVVEVTGDEWVERLITISRNHCGRFGAGNGTMSFLYDYAREHNGKLVTGAGFPEYYPDENISYMQTRYVDSKMNNKEGYLIHEPDIVQTIMYPEMPFNFLSWTPEIVLSYVAARDLSKNNEENKEMLTRCYPRPKNMGIPAFVFSSDYELSNIIGLKDYLGSSECDFLGSKDDLIKLLS